MQAPIETRDPMITFNEFIHQAAIIFEREGFNIKRSAAFGMIVLKYFEALLQQQTPLNIELPTSLFPIYKEDRENPHNIKIYIPCQKLNDEQRRNIDSFCNALSEWVSKSDSTALFGSHHDYHREEWIIITLDCNFLRNHLEQIEKFLPLYSEAHANAENLREAHWFQAVEEIFTWYTNNGLNLLGVDIFEETIMRLAGVEEKSTSCLFDSNIQTFHLELGLSYSSGKKIETYLNSIRPNCAVLLLEEDKPTIKIQIQNQVLFELTPIIIEYCKQEPQSLILYRLKTLAVHHNAACLQFKNKLEKTVEQLSAKLPQKDSLFAGDTSLINLKKILQAMIFLFDEIINSAATPEKKDVESFLVELKSLQILKASNVKLNSELISNISKIISMFNDLLDKLPLNMNNTYDATLTFDYGPKFLSALMNFRANPEEMMEGMRAAYKNQTDEQKTELMDQINPLVGIPMPAPAPMPAAEDDSTNESEDDNYSDNDELSLSSPRLKG